MNSYERFKNRIKGKPVDRPPNFDIIMQFAAHYIGSLLRPYYWDHRVLVEANMAMLTDFDLDIVQTISDPYRETHDFGAIVEYPDDDLPMALIPLIAEPEDLKKLKSPDPYTSQRMSDRLEAIRLFREKVGGEVPIMGWVEGALAQAADLRGISNIMTDLYDRPAWVQELLEQCVEVEIAFAKAQVEAGADIIGLGDAVASQVNPKMYRKFALPYEQRIFEAVREAGGYSRLHICGNTSRIVADMVDSGADIVDIDWMVDIDRAAEAFADKVALLGNFDPVVVMLQGTPDEVYHAVTDCLKRGGPRSISGAGCEIPDATPHENMHAQTQALRDYGKASS
jgi:MtaA/CmuA family methyltransferase